MVLEELTCSFQKILNNQEGLIPHAGLCLSVCFLEREDRTNPACIQCLRVLRSCDRVSR